MESNLKKESDVEVESGGICKIKSEFILPEKVRELSFECLSENDKKNLQQDYDQPPNKKEKLSKKLRGQNKKRGPTFRRNDEIELCNSLILVNEVDGEESRKCEKKNCKFLHNIEEYLKNKPQDIGAECYNFNTFGYCPRGLSCRFGNSHIVDGKNIIDKKDNNDYNLQTKNHLKLEIQEALRKRTYDFYFSDGIVKKEKALITGAITDEDLIKLTNREKKKIDWTNKLFLSSLTTLGNLPFRRICKEFGADVTCGEMAMSSLILQGSPQEWALVKRHHSETLFGVQLCANNPFVLTKCGQLLQEQTDIDYIEINLGCPLEFVCNKGGGCGLLRRPNILEQCIKCISKVLTIPLTVKTRTGVYNGQNVAHIFAPKFKEWGVSLMTIHGRTKEQRYTKTADWTYIKEVANVAAPMPVIGNGDILSYEDYKLYMSPELNGVMIGRGALMKPWIFTEIKEQKLWDISSCERFDILKKFTNYGLEHWGSDNKGVENTRRFLLEWLSFLYRYIPVGILERPPQKINERPPLYKGRNDLETLMASPSATDWIKISEMLLGKVPDGFQFLPKHKANSYK